MIRKWMSIGLFLLLFTGCSKGIPPESPAPEFTLKDPMNGKKVSLSDFKGSPIVIYWFTSW